MGLGVALVDVHALAGRAVLEVAAAAIGGRLPTRLLAVTVLTSHDEATLAEIGLAGPVAAAVERLALLARSAGAHGVVASPHEVRRDPRGLRRRLPDRDTGHPTCRSQAPATRRAPRRPQPPSTAGADYVVVGRPITEAPDPAAAAAAIVAEMAPPTRPRADQVDRRARSMVD